MQERPDQPIDDDSVKTGVLVSAVLHAALILAAIAPAREALPPVEGGVQVQLISMDEFNRIFGAADAAAAPSTAISENRNETPRPDLAPPTVDAPQPEPSVDVAAMVNPALPESPPVVVDRPEPLALETPEVTAPAPLAPPALVDAPAEAVDLSAPPAPRIAQPAPLSPPRGIETTVDIAVDRDEPPAPEPPQIAETPPAATPEPITLDPDAAAVAAAPAETPLAAEAAETRPAEQSAPDVPEQTETADAASAIPRPPRLRPARPSQEAPEQTAVIPDPPRLRPRRAPDPQVAERPDVAPEPTPPPPSQRPRGRPGLEPADSAVARSETLPSQTLTPQGDADRATTAQTPSPPPPPVTAPPGLTFGAARDILRGAQAAWLSDMRAIQTGFAFAVSPEDVRRRIEGLEETRADIIRYGLPDAQRIMTENLIAQERQLLSAVAPGFAAVQTAAPPLSPALEPEPEPQAEPAPFAAQPEPQTLQPEPQTAARSAAQDEARRRQREAAAARRAEALRRRQELERRRQQDIERQRRARLSDSAQEAAFLDQMAQRLQNGGGGVARSGGGSEEASTARAGFLPSPTQGDDARSELTALEARAVVDQIARCWRFPNLRPPLGADTVVVLRFELNRVGEVLPRTIRREGAAATTENGRLAEAYARAALTRAGCGRFFLPPDKYASWRVLEFVFDTPAAARRGDAAAGLSER